MLKFVTTYWKTIVFAFCILLLSTAPLSGHKLTTIAHADKVIHLFMYLFFTCVLFYDYSRNYTVKTVRSYALLLLLPILYGGLMEIVQEFLTISRSADGFDILANSAGTVLGLAISATIYNVRR